MKFALSCNHTIATILALLYLVLPATNIAHAATLETAASGGQIFSGIAFTAPASDCPDSDGRHSDCCDATFCSCACHVPLSQGHRFTYSPTVLTQRFPEPSWSLSQVDRPIFVPPQNPA